jgi:RNA-splicing ligase RtcB
VAQALPHNKGLVDCELAVFVADTPRMAAYRNDLFWAQEYAKRNRALMMGLLQDVDARGGVPQGLRGRRRDPGAYKPIEKVIDQQRGLVEVVAKLKQVVCVKG